MMIIMNMGSLIMPFNISDDDDDDEDEDEDEDEDDDDCNEYGYLNDAL